jgi:hypothetical protein
MSAYFDAWHDAAKNSADAYHNQALYAWYGIPRKMMHCKEHIIRGL